MAKSRLGKASSQLVDLTVLVHHHSLEVLKRRRLTNLLLQLLSRDTRPPRDFTVCNVTRNTDIAVR